MLSHFSWFDLLNLFAAIITVIGAANFIFKKAFNEYKQRLAKLNKRLRLFQIKKLRRQYFISKLIDENTSYLIAYCARNIGGVLILLMMMSFIGFIFLYLDHGLFKLVGGFYMLGIIALAISYFDEFTDVLIGIKSPIKFRVKLKESLLELRSQ
ncbi:hypothetical protein [Colwellia sp. TT2012]|uniref:hypothetical protein n=1 Tax=Colwellia sp. TT2012 TaxID=1720342 RepID=UPI000A4D9F75|nr:hypothetical protein [Colwellia sp. TT2012]